MALVKDAVARAVLSGHWEHLATRAAAVDPTVPVDRLRRLPAEDEVWMVRPPTAVRMLTGGAFRAAAAAGGDRAARRRVMPAPPDDVSAAATNHAHPRPPVEAHR